MCPLDLSSNNIEKIEGLESLSKLEVLNLSNNKISVLENMDTLVELTHFNIAHNSLGKLDQVTFPFRNLFNITCKLCCNCCVRFLFFSFRM